MHRNIVPQYYFSDFLQINYSQYYSRQDYYFKWDPVPAGQVDCSVFIALGNKNESHQLYFCRLKLPFGFNPCI